MQFAELIASWNIIIFCNRIQWNDRRDEKTALKIRMNTTLKYSLLDKADMMKFTSFLSCENSIVVSFSAQHAQFFIQLAVRADKRMND